jgi:hypothetical protein
MVELYLHDASWRYVYLIKRRDTFNITFTRCMFRCVQLFPRHCHQLSSHIMFSERNLVPYSGLLGCDVVLFGR